MIHNQREKKLPKASPFPVGSCGTHESNNSRMYQAPVVQKLDSAIQWINHYPLDNSIGFASVYPLDSDLSGGQRYPSFEQLWPGH